MQINWENKYKELKLKFKDTVDLAFRLGVEEGMRQGQVQQAQQAQQAAAAAQMQPGQDPNAQPGQEMNDPGSPDGSELDQHIGQLESMLQGSKPGSMEQQGLQKSLDGIKAFRSNLKQASDLRKSEKAIREIGKAINAPFTLNKAATKNLSESGKKALNMQEQIVSDLMKAMDEEQAKAAEAITKTLNFEQVLKG